VNLSTVQNPRYVFEEFAARPRPPQPVEAPVEAPAVAAPAKKAPARKPAAKAADAEKVAAK
jgi:NADH dehydrogenase